MQEWIMANLSGAALLIGAAAATLIQISPIKLNPWSWLGEAIGRFIGVAAIRDKLDAHIRLDDERHIKQCRMRILRFSDEVLQGASHTKEHYDEVLDDITEYNRYCAAHPEFKNSKAEMSVDNVKQAYQLNLRDNSFLCRREFGK